MLPLMLCTQLLSGLLEQLPQLSELADAQACALEVDPELGGLLARGDVAMRLRVDIRVESKRDRGDLTQGGRDPAHRLQFLAALHVEQEDARLERLPR